MARKILVVDDDKEFLIFMHVVLERAGFLAMLASGREAAAKWLAEPGKPDAIVLDVNLAQEGPDGLEFCAWLKKDPATARIPVLVLTALNDNQARLRASTASADLMLNKPIKPAELVKGLENLLKGPAKTRRGRFERGSFVIDPESNEVSFHGRAFRDLSPALFELLHLLASHYPDVLSRDFLLAAIRRKGGRDREIDVLISRLRGRLRREFGLNFVATVSGKGYCLEIPVRKPSPAT